ncbi:MAG: four helix bundle protein [Bacteroidales bacterium]|jgi:four helix bundle protein
METHRDLNVWKVAVDFVTTIYKTTGSFPPSELFGLTNQMRRAAVSIPSNIAEGAGRKSPKEFCQFLSFALGSIAELETQLIISGNLKYISQNHQDELLKTLLEIRKMTLGLKKVIELKNFNSRM